MLPPAESPKELLALYRSTHYDVRLPRGQRVTLRIGVRVPDAIAEYLAPETICGFISACNPRSRPLAAIENRCRNRELLDALASPSVRILPGVGRIPGHTWREPSLLVFGVSLATLDGLARRFHQNAIAYASGHEPVRLRIYRNEWHTELIAADLHDCEWA